MTNFRWFILRLFWSLLLLPFVASALLWLQHEIISPGGAFADKIVVALVWMALFAVVSFILTRLGAKRFSLLEEAGRVAISKNQNEQVEEVLARLQTLFTGGLLSNNFQQKVKSRLLRQYFSFYSAQPEKEPHREQIVTAMRVGIRAEESYEILKNYVLQQPALTLPIIDLAEELLERQPDDSELRNFLAREYLRERQTHFRAEFIFAHYLARNGPLAPEIVALCLDRLLSRKTGRQDDFAAWCYVRAFQHGGEKNSLLRQRLYAAHQRFQRAGGRHDALAKAVASLATEFTPEEISGWAVVARQEKPARPLRFRAARAVFYLQQQFLTLYSRLREQHKWLYGLAAVIMIVSVSYFALSGKTAKVRSQAAAAKEDSTTVYFALQVGALRNMQLAAREAEKFRRRGLEVHVLKPEPSQRLHRIRVGKYRSKPAAQTAADSLKALGLVRDCFIAEYEKQ